MKFNTVLRFAVMSDIHYQEESDFQRQRFENAMNTVYNYCGAENYKNLDALYVVGDFADTGTKTQMEMFYDDCKKNVRPETQLVVTLANHELHYVDDYRQSMKNFQEIFNMDFDRHIVLAGYHLISLSTTIDKGPWHDSFDIQKCNWLKQELEIARNDSGNKPVFVFQHPGIFGTVSGGVYGNNELYYILSDYPQVIDFSGHSHFPVNDPREIHQNHFTSISTGSLYNISSGSALVCPHISESAVSDSDCAHMLVVEVDEKSAVRIRRLDVVAGDFFENDYYIEDAYNKSKHKYTLKRAINAPVPYFDNDADIKLARDGDKLNVTFPRAHCDGERVREYNIRIVDKNGVVIRQKSMASDFACLNQKSFYSVSFENVPANACLVQVFAVGFWDNCSIELTKKIV